MERIKTFVEASAVAVTGNVTATGTVEPAGDTASGDNAAIGYTSGEGLILTGQGSTIDVTIKNDADTAVISIPTGTTTTTFAGQIKINNDGCGTKHCWNNKHKINIKNFYCKTNYFNQIYSDLEVLYDKKYNKLTGEFYFNNFHM